MKRLFAMAVVGLALCAGPTLANGWGGHGWGIHPGYFNAGLNLHSMWGHGAPPGAPCAPGGGGGGATPGHLGPWYLYWPYQAHFQTPALPQYPYWNRGQTLPNGMPYASPPGMVVPSSPPSYWH